ncbi:hypothetical protein TNCV_2357091 [Trichonephila clavipes]|nr:hypothetical protein TNCV_2357091 [Trichonephila clavipes]
MKGSNAIGRAKSSVNGVYRHYNWVANQSGAVKPPSLRSSTPARVTQSEQSAIQSVLDRSEKEKKGLNLE